jgi:hypothetical protein
MAALRGRLGFTALPAATWELSMRNMVIVPYLLLSGSLVTGCVESPVDPVMCWEETATNSVPMVYRPGKHPPTYHLGDSKIVCAPVPTKLRPAVQSATALWNSEGSAENSEASGVAPSGGAATSSGSGGTSGVGGNAAASSGPGGTSASGGGAAASSGEGGTSAGSGGTSASSGPGGSSSSGNGAAASSGPGGTSAAGGGASASSGPGGTSASS